MIISVIWGSMGIKLPKGGFISKCIDVWHSHFSIENFIVCKNFNKVAFLTESVIFWLYIFVFLFHLSFTIFQYLFFLTNINNFFTGKFKVYFFCAFMHFLFLKLFFIFEIIFYFWNYFFLWVFLFFYVLFLSVCFWSTNNSVFYVLVLSENHVSEWVVQI